jgi:hydrogenase maturation protease
LRRDRNRSRKKGPLIPSAKEPAPAILVLGIGNPGRTDDGLGIQAAERLEALGLPGVTCDANYQLNVEDALSCARHDVVVFVDAAKGLRTAYRWTEVEPEPSIPAMTHSLGPGAVLSVCAALYGKTPKAHLLGVRGHRWEIGEGLSARAEADLGEALRFLEGFIKGKQSKKGRGR